MIHSNRASSNRETILSISKFFFHLIRVPIEKLIIFSFESDKKVTRLFMIMNLTRCKKTRKSNDVKTANIKINKQRNKR